MHVFRKYYHKEISFFFAKRFEEIKSVELRSILSDISRKVSRIPNMSVLMYI